MIKGFSCRDTEHLFADGRVPKFVGIESPARRKLLYLNQARNLQDLRNPPGNRLEALSGNRQGQFSIRINDQWRVCFKWDEGDVYNVEIVDHH